MVHLSRPPEIPIVVGAGEEEGSSAADDLPACQSCRRRKLKCSRQTPSCLQCQRLAGECVYVSKQKPGVKTGAVDTLSRRLDVLERILLDESGRRKPQLALLDLDPEHLNGNDLPGSQHQTRNLDHNQNLHQRHQTDNPVTVSDSASPAQAGGSSHKRRRTNDVDPDIWAEEDGPPPPTPPYLLNAIIDVHFRTVHHWVPILHQARFRARLQDPAERSRLAVLLHSLVAAGIKYIELDKVGLCPEDVERQIRASRRVVMLHAMQSLSVENMQALIFLAFDYMGCGHPSKAWPIIGSLTRTVEYLQLTVEPPDLSSQKQPLLRPLTLLSWPRDWTESEERRRLFWNVFLLDRVCSVTAGWHTSLTSDHVQRRLPCSGAPWAREEAVSTPFFGIWNKSAAKIGQSIANVPALYESTSKTSDYSPSGGGGGGGDQLDTSNLGAFAYCIEATENLSQVTSFFLQQSIDFEDREQVKNWLTRFKELDLRLVHWKMFLPHQWHDSDVSCDVSVVRMDPNLTLAHLTHNAATILLHQHVAYPPATWCGVVKLPSACSAETCLLAAIEIASIADKYLRYMGGIVNSQFAFCAFVAARTLLVHWLSVSRGTGDPLAPEFLSLVDSLRDMSRRWRGGYGRDGEEIMGQDDGDNERRPAGPDLMTKYAIQLQLMHSRCMTGLDAHASVGDILSDASLDGLLDRQQQPVAGSDPSRRDMILPQTPGLGSGSMMPSGFSPFIHPRGSVPHPPIGYDPRGTPVRPNVVNPRRRRRQQQQHDAQRQEYYGTNTTRARAPSMMATSPSSTAAVGGILGLGMEHTNSSSNGVGGGEDEDELTAMSHMLLGQQFLELDRVITLDGTDFFGPTTPGVKNGSVALDNSVMANGNLDFLWQCGGK